MAIRQWDLEVLVHREIVEQMVLLKDEAYLFIPQRGALLWFQMMNGSFVQRIFALPTVVVHSENVQKRRFTSARRTHDRNKFAFGDVQIDIAQDIEKFLLPQRVPAFEIFKSDHTGHYSVRSACIGFTRVARLAGNHVAIRAAAARTRGAAVNATGSSAPTSYKIPLRALAVAIESNSPITTPLTSMIDPSRMIILRTAPV